MKFTFTYIYELRSCVILYYTADCQKFLYPPTKTHLCPGENITYTCTTNSSNEIVNMIWTGSGFHCTNPTNAIILQQTAKLALNTTIKACGNLSAVMTNLSNISAAMTTNLSCYTSVLTIPNLQDYNGTTVQCYNGQNKNIIVGNYTLNITLEGKLDVIIYCS